MILREILSDICVLETHADLDMEISGVSYHSGRTQPGELFFAITGFASDGHHYIGAAVTAGAAAVVCEKRPETDIPYLLVENSRLALALSSKRFFGNPAGRMKLIGVTGTNGKTTSTLLIKHILEKSLGAKVGLIGTNANMIGDRVLDTERTTPESFELQKLFFEMAEEGCAYAVMEVSSHALILDRVAGVRFASAVFTNLTQDHLDFHKTMDAYADAKARLFHLCDAAVINCDDPYAKRMVMDVSCNILRYSAEASTDLYATDISLFPNRAEFLIHYGDEALRASLPIPGRFSVYNALDAVGCCMTLGVPFSACVDALTDASGVKGRMETVYAGEDYTVLIDYSHTPDSLENVLKAVRETGSGRVVALFGCGGDRDRTKRPIMGHIGTELADFAVITSDNPRTEDPEEIIREIVAGVDPDRENYTVIPDRREAIRFAMEHHLPGDVIVLAGKGHETYQEINHVKYHMDEREIVSDILDGRQVR